VRHYWLDRIVRLEPGVGATGVKGVALSEDHFDSHFPGNPVLPGVCVLEGLAQTGGVLLHQSVDCKLVALMVSVERARFLAFARPGDQLVFEVAIESLDGQHARVRGEARVGGRTVASARFTFRLVPPDQLIPEAYRPLWEQGIQTWLGRYPEIADE
jgi:3-hydroxymyristoyl/3-hydroxydecanoyl-(acyl carrier protein) dehydratase